MWTQQQQQQVNKESKNRLIEKERKEMVIRKEGIAGWVKKVKGNIINTIAKRLYSAR